MNMSRHAASSFALLVLILGAAAARAETVNCMPVTALPAVITVQGIYCFTGDLATSVPFGNAIEIQTNNVVLDLNGHKLGGLAAGPSTQAVGIYAADHQNITIRNGTIRGFFYGIALDDLGASQGHVVEDIRADQNTREGIDVRGSGVIIRNNQVVATGGTTVFGSNASAIGIVAIGSGARVLNNDVIKTVKQGTGISYGIVFAFGSIGALAVNNRITQADHGLDYQDTSAGKYRDNVTFNVATPYTGGTNVGNNN